MDSGFDCRWFGSTEQRSDCLARALTPISKSYLEKYWTNPQYLVRLNFIDDGDDENLCTMIIALMQKDTRQRRIRGLEGEDYVQFRVFKVRH